MSDLDCLCAGIVVADFVCTPAPRLPGPGELVMTDGISIAIGGCAANVAVDLARLDRRAAIVGRVGDDPSGRVIRQALDEVRVDTAWLLETPGVGTSSTLIVNVRGEDRRFIHAAASNSVFDGSEVTQQAIRAARILYLGGFLLMPRLPGEAAARLLRMAREAGVRTVLDVVIPDPEGGLGQLEKVLPWTDVFLPNTDESRQLTGLADPRDQAERFRQAGAGTVVVTCGRDGALLVDGHQTLRSGSYSVDFVDGTGSGDAFAAGYIHGMLDDLPPERCLELGSALGASCVRQPGATTGVFNRGELKAFVEAQRLSIQRIEPR